MTRSYRVGLIWFATVLLGITGIVLMMTNPAGFARSFTPHSLVSVGFATVGGLIMLRRPHRIGTMFMGFGVLTAVTGFLFQACPSANDARGGLATLCGEEGRIGLFLWPAGYLFLGFLFLLFPTGRLPSRRWRPVAGAFLGSWGAMGVLSLLFGDRWVEDHFGWLIPIAVWLLAAAATAPLFRIRKTDPIERQQLRWVGYVIALTLLLIAIGVALDAAGEQTILNMVNVLIFANAAIGIPVAITVAILRYRLYEIDLIVNRTLVYVLLTGGLAAAYLGSVVLLQRILSPITTDSDIAVAGSTLAVAALFRPMRARFQAFIDHRFFRRKYDARATLEAFAAHLRDEVDLASLSRSLTTTVGGAMQPAHVSLWLRTEGTSR